MNRARVCIDALAGLHPVDRHRECISLEVSNRHLVARVLVLRSGPDGRSISKSRRYRFRPPSLSCERFTERAGEALQALTERSTLSAVTSGRTLVLRRGETQGGRLSVRLPWRGRGRHHLPGQPGLPTEVRRGNDQVLLHTVLERLGAHGLTDYSFDGRSGIAVRHGAT
jgi:hypothetical protein